MVVRKRQIIAAALVLALGSAVFINWYYNRPSVKSANAKPSVEAVDNTGGNLGDAQLVNSSGVSERARRSPCASCRRITMSRYISMSISRPEPRFRRSRRIFRRMSRMPSRA